MMELCLGQPIGNRLLIDKKPAFSLMALGFQRIFPEIKFIVALRDPRDVCLSCFMQYFTPINLRNAAFFNLKGHGGGICRGHEHLADDWRP